jgi:hypothetical protein
LGSIFHVIARSIRNLLYFPVTAACVVISTATHLHGIKHDEYINNHYVN